MKKSGIARLFAFMQVLYDLTDDEHPKTREEIEELLKKNDIEMNRKTFYTYIEELKSAGIDVASKKTDKYYYYINRRQFDFAETKLLIDAVQSARFITKEKSEELIKKIGKLMSLYQAADLKRKLYMSERTKTVNKNIYKNVDDIHDAIIKNRKISFRYFDYTLDVNHAKKKHYRKQGKEYVISPYSLVWAEDNYYVISHYPEHTGLTNFRVDRMDLIQVTNQPRELLSKATGKSDFSISRYSQNIFSMFSGDVQWISLKFDNDLLNTAIDRFGHHAQMRRNDEHTFIADVEVQVSPTFFAWLFQFGKKVRILSPVSAQKQYVEYCEAVLQQYRP
jgi:predicted DNA-binding transcriptional regulator YafY